jgi:predicted MFS family arabinose efflux permease
MLAALVLHGLANGPMNIGLFALRQRRTDPEWLGRALAVSASLNYAGFPLGSAAAGALVGGSIAAALGLGALAALAAAASLPAIPRARTPEKGVIRVA